MGLLSRSVGFCCAKEEIEIKQNNARKIFFIIDFLITNNVLLSMKLQ
jgi:hypothetical protein